MAPFVNPQIFRRLFAPVLDNFETDLGALIEAAEAQERALERPSCSSR